MSDLQVQSLLEGIAALLWPLIVIALILVLRPAILRFLGSEKFQRFSLKVAGQELTMEQVDQSFQILIKGLVTDYEYDKLKGLATDYPFLVRFHWSMYDELRHLEALRYIEVLPGNELDAIKAHDGSVEEFDLKTYVKITPEGLEYLKLRDKLFAS